VRQPLGCLALCLFLAAPAYAQGPSARSWQDCLKAPDRACVLDEAIGLVNPLDNPDRRLALVAAAAQIWAQVGEIDRALELAAQVPDRLFVRIGVLQEIAAAQARAGHPEQAEATFGQALQLADNRKNAMQRAEALHAIARAEVAAGMKAAADATFDQALQAAAAVHIVGEKGRVTPPIPESRLAFLLQELAMQRAETGDMAHALQIARSIPSDSQTRARARARTLLALADLQTRAGSAAEETLGDALAAEHDARSGPVEWSSYRDIGNAVSQSPGDYLLLCGIAKAQARAGLTAKAVATFDEALRAAQATMTGFQGRGDAAVAGALVNVSDAQREAGLTAAARETLDRATTLAEALTDDRDRAQVLPLLAEMRIKAGDLTPDLFARSLAAARALQDDRHRAHALELAARAQANAGLRDDAARTFAEAAGIAARDGQTLSSIALAQANAGLRDDAARTFAEAVSVIAQDEQMLSSIADAQRSTGFIAQAATTFEQSLAVTVSGDEREKVNRVVLQIHRIAGDRGSELVAASPTLGVRLVEAAQAVTNPMTRADVLLIIARTLPN